MMFLMVFAHFFDTKDEGWHFYHDPNVMPSKKENKTASKQTPHNAPKSLKDLKAKAEALLEEAVFNPTLQNIGRYQRLQKHIMEKSERFANLWAENLLLEPDLDSTIDAPTSYYGILAQKEESAHQKKLDIQRIAETCALVLLIDDTYLSKQLYTIVKSMSEEHKIPLVTVDARFDPEHQKAQWKIKRIPVLLMIKRSNGTVSIVTYGLQAQDALEKRMRSIVSQSSITPRGGQYL